MKLSSIVGKEESLGRYLPHKRYFSRQHNSVRPMAFLPPPDFRLSVFRIDGLDENQIWEIGQCYVIKNSQRTLYGVADIKVSKVQNNGLHVDPDNVPIRHANIVGWPEEREKRQSIAQELAAVAILKLKE